MPALGWKIIRPDGSSLKDADGREIILPSRTEAESWLRRDEQVELVRPTSQN